MKKISKNRTLIVKYTSKIRKTSEYWKLNTATLIAMLPAALLTGCMGIYEGGFECPAGVGVGCKSISEVHSMIERGTLPKAQAEQLDPSKFESSKPEIWYAPRSSIPEASVTGVQNKGCRNREENLQGQPLETEKSKRDLNEKITL